MDGKLIDLPTSELLKKFGAGSHKPGSGSAAALQGILGAQLLRTVIQLTKGKKRYSAHLPELLHAESEIETGLLPELENLFHEDSKQFDVVIKLRKQRGKTRDAQQKKALTEKAVNALVPATEIPIEIANKSLKIARFALLVFDHGFQSARGDSGVAINSALAAVAGCLSVVELNLLSFEANDWTQAIQESATKIRDEFQELERESQRRLSEQFSLAEENKFLHLELQSISTSLKGKTISTEVKIEQLVVRLQRTLWRYRRLIWKTRNIDPFEILKPERVLRLFGFQVNKSTELGSFEMAGKWYDVAGQIDQNEGLVYISELLGPEIQNFTSAHELGHSVLHTQALLHRDRPVERTRLRSNSSPEEWQADKFAAYFLMPKKLVLKTFEQVFGTSQFIVTPESAVALGGYSVGDLRKKAKDLRGLSRMLAGAKFFHTSAIKPLAQRFNVSVEAMAIRLEELKLVRFS